MKVMFKGDGDHAETVAFGQSFPAGEWIETDAAKLGGNPAFAVEGSEEPASDEPSVEELRAKLDELGVSYHHNAGVPKLLALLADASAE